MVTEGELVLVQDEGEYILRPGDCAAWKAGDTNGHTFVNRTDREARFLAVGSKARNEVVSYLDVDYPAWSSRAASRSTPTATAPPGTARANFDDISINTSTYP